MQKHFKLYQFWPLAPILLMIFWIFNRASDSPDIIRQYELLNAALEQEIAKITNQNRALQDRFQLEYQTLAQEQWLKPNHQTLYAESLNARYLSDSLFYLLDSLQSCLLTAIDNKTRIAITPSSLSNLKKKIEKQRKQNERLYLLAYTEPSVSKPVQINGLFPDLIPNDFQKWESTNWYALPLEGKLATIKRLKLQLRQAEQLLYECFLHNLPTGGCKFRPLNFTYVGYPDKEVAPIGEEVSIRVYPTIFEPNIIANFESKQLLKPNDLYVNSRILTIPTDQSMLPERLFQTFIPYEWSVDVQQYPTNLFSVNANPINKKITYRDSFYLIRPETEIKSAFPKTLIRYGINGFDVKMNSQTMFDWGRNPYGEKIYAMPSIEPKLIRGKAILEKNCNPERPYCCRGYYIIPESDTVVLQYSYKKYSNEILQHIIIAIDTFLVQDYPFRVQIMSPRNFKPDSIYSINTSFRFSFYTPREFGNEFCAIPQTVVLEYQNTNGEFVTAHIFKNQLDTKENRSITFMLSKFLPAEAKGKAFRIHLRDVVMNTKFGIKPLKLSQNDRCIVGWLE